MNKRIEALLEQARTKDYWSEGRYLVDFINQEKFAQLIVRECAAIAKDSQDFYDEHNDGVCNDDIGALIKHAFGVKE